MIHQTDKGFIEECLNNYALNNDLVNVAKEPPFDVQQGGVPPAMFNGAVDAEGWVKWKMLPSTVTEDDILEIEKMLHGQFPPLFRAFLTARFTMGIETAVARLPALPSDNPLGDLLMELKSRSALFASGYVAFAEDGNDAGPLCFDFVNRLPDADCPVVLFDHERLINLGEENCAVRGIVSTFAIPVFPSFREMIKELCF